MESPLAWNHGSDGSFDYDPKEDRLVAARASTGPQNAPGPFYVADQCILCGLPPETAPETISFLREGDCPDHCRFHKQPETEDELTHVMEAMEGSCVAAIRYRGTHADILRKLRARNMADLADALLPERT